MTFFYETCRDKLPRQMYGYVTDYDTLRDELRRQLRATELELHRAKERGATMQTIIEIIEERILK